jgi:hypothetical protein
MPSAPLHFIVYSPDNQYTRLESPSNIFLVFNIKRAITRQLYGVIQNIDHVDSTSNHQMYWKLQLVFNLI